MKILDDFDGRNIFEKKSTATKGYALTAKVWTDLQFEAVRIWLTRVSQGRICGGRSLSLGGGKSVFEWMKRIQIGVFLKSLTRAGWKTDRGGGLQRLI